MVTHGHLTGKDNFSCTYRRTLKNKSYSGASKNSTYRKSTSGSRKLIRKTCPVKHKGPVI